MTSIKEYKYGTVNMNALKKLKINRNHISVTLILYLCKFVMARSSQISVLASALILAMMAWPSLVEASYQMIEYEYDSTDCSGAPTKVFRNSGVDTGTCFHLGSPDGSDTYAEIRFSESTITFDPFVDPGCTINDPIGSPVSYENNTCTSLDAKTVTKYVWCEGACSLGPSSSTTANASPTLTTTTTAATVTSSLPTTSTLASPSPSGPVNTIQLTQFAYDTADCSGSPTLNNEFSIVSGECRMASISSGDESYEMLTIHGSSGRLQVYSDSDCTQLSEGTEEITFTKDECFTSSVGSFPSTKSQKWTWAGEPNPDHHKGGDASSLAASVAVIGTALTLLSF